jgi:hypothetical protein
VKRVYTDAARGDRREETYLGAQENKNEKTKSTVYSQEFGVNVLYPPAHHSSSVLFFLSLLLPIVFPFALTYIYNNAEQKENEEKKKEKLGAQEKQLFCHATVCCYSATVLLFFIRDVLCVFVVSPNVF